MSPSATDRPFDGSAMHEIVVGIENTEQSAHALRWAIQLADSLGGTTRIHAVHVLRAPPAGALGLPSHIPSSLDEERRTAAEDALDELVRQSATGSAIEIDGQVIEGNPARTLLELAQDADLLVLGATDKGRLTGVVLGSTSLRCVTEGTVPVAIIPQEQTASGRITNDHQGASETPPPRRS